MIKIIFFIVTVWYLPWILVDFLHPTIEPIPLFIAMAIWLFIAFCLPAKPDL